MSTKAELQLEIKRLNKRIEKLESGYKDATEKLVEVLEVVTPFIPVFNKALEEELHNKIDKW